MPNDKVLKWSHNPTKEIWWELFVLLPLGKLEWAKEDPPPQMDK